MSSLRSIRMWRFATHFGMILVLLAAEAARAQAVDMSKASGEKTRRVVLVGASVGKAWVLPGLPRRVHETGFEFEYVGKYKFDKSEEIEALLARESDRPDGIIIKECAAFFPGDTTRYRELVRSWVDRCRAERVTPILATIVPVARTYPIRTFFLELIHGRIAWPSRTFDAVIAFNDWLRAYAREEGLAVIDLEAAVRRSPEDRHLRESFARRDGLHLNAKAYRALDAIVYPSLRGVAWSD